MKGPFGRLAHVARFRRTLRTRVIDELMDRFGLADAAQGLRAQEHQLGAVRCTARELRSRVADEHLSAGRERPQPRRPIDGEAVVVAVTFDGLARVDSHPHPDRC